MPKGLYIVQYVELTPAQTEEADELEILSVVAEVDGDPDAAITFWGTDMEWNVIDFFEVQDVKPQMYMSPEHYMVF